ncbi:MAG TPA: hypothetical protein VL027_08300 [Spongiibacteraceae bacterium]|nr:hypothetical protein [Spongiibacteraceae bacterium]HUH37930.1 hypothetical protein [Spongiibacteraceae bacterium]
MTLAIILLVLLASLWLLVTLGERWFKPPEPARMGRLSAILMVLMGLLILAQGLRYWLG